MSTEVVKRENNQQIEAVADRTTTVRPAVDIYENKDEYLIVADMPAVTKNALSIHLEESQLTIEGNVTEEESSDALEREFRLINYRRSFKLPEFVDREKVAAELKHGVLTLHLPKTDAIKPKRIEVRAG